MCLCVDVCGGVCLCVEVCVLMYGGARAYVWKCANVWRCVLMCGGVCLCVEVCVCFCGEVGVKWNNM